MTDDARTDVLLVEDNDGDARLIELGLAEERRDGVRPFALHRADRLAAALERVRAGGVDVVLLDLNLPDSAGYDTFLRVRAAAPDVPVVVLSGLADEELGARAVREGAQDYLVKGQSPGPVLARSLRYAIERRRAEREEAARGEAERALDIARRAEDRRRAELRAVERLAAPAAASSTARSFGVEPLSRALPDRFGDLVSRYASLLDQALEQRAYKVERRTSDGLRSLADELGFLRAGPRDVVELHTAALRGRIESASPQKAQAYVDEGRVLALELMGHLVAYYRA